MSYDSWKTTNPDDEWLGDAPQRDIIPRGNITTSYCDVWREWMAFEGDYDLGVPVGYGKTEAEAIEDLVERLS